MSIAKLIPLLLSIAFSQAFQLPTNRDNVSSTSTKSTVASAPTIPVREASTLPIVQRPKWGTDANEREDEYWYDQRIHTLGNIGLSGAIHAALAPVSTKIIDVKAYDGIDVRGKVRRFW